MDETYTILLVDDEASILSAHDTILRSAGVQSVCRVSDAQEVMPALEETPVELILLDLKMPGISGEALLEKIRRQHPEVPVIVVTGLEDVATAVRCMQLGAFDYLVKPVEKSRLVGTVHRALELQGLRRENLRLKEAVSRGSLTHPEAFSDIVTQNDAMFRLFLLTETVARSREPVLITGETGTGKELLARAVHTSSEMEGEYVIANVAGFDDTMFSDALFGHRSGAFTGASGTRKGIVATARRGTLVLDEIGDLSIHSQVKLLRLLENREYLPLGSDVVRRSEARIVLSTSHDLRALVESGSFRRDLYYRLSTHQLRIPPLRDRIEDVPLLFERFLSIAAGELDKPMLTAPKEVLDLLSGYRFPGNVRELRSLAFAVEAAAVDDSFPAEVVHQAIGAERSGTEGVGVTGRAPKTAPDGDLPTIQQAVSDLIDEALRRAGGVQATAARFLGISPQALSRRLQTRARSRDRN